MHYIMFYGGMFCAFAGLICAVCIYYKKDIADCIKNMFKWFIIGVVCIGMMTEAQTADGERNTEDEEKTQIISDVQYMTRDHEKIEERENVIYCGVEKGLVISFGLQEASDEENTPEDVNGDTDGEDTPENVNSDTDGEDTPENGNSDTDGEDTPENVNGDTDGGDTPEDVNGDTDGEDTPEDRNGDTDGEDTSENGNSDTDGEGTSEDESSDTGEDSDEADEDDSRTVYIMIEGMDLRFPVIESGNGVYSIEMFGKDWKQYLPDILENGVFDGVFEICVEDAGGSTACMSTLRIVYGEVFPEAFVSAVSADQRNSVKMDTQPDDDVKWTNEQIELEISAHDIRALRSLEYKIGNDVTVEKYNDETDGISKSVIIAGLPADSGGIAIDINVTNIFGNTTYVAGRAYYDNEAPVISDVMIAGDGNNHVVRDGIIFSNSDMTAYFSIGDNISGVLEESITAEFVPVSYGGSTENVIPLTLEKKAVGEYCVYCKKPDGGVLDGYINVCGYDLAGNKQEGQSRHIICSGKKPEIEIISSSYFKKWNNEDEKIHISVDSSACGLNKVAIYVAGKKVEEIEPDILLLTYEHDILIDKSSDKISGYSVEVKAVDNCGNESQRKNRVYIDKEPPEIKLTGINQGIHSAVNLNLKCEVSDVSFKDTIVNISVQRIHNGKSYEEGKSDIVPKDYTDKKEILFTKEGEYRVNVRATDGAGNISRSEELRFIIDKTTPQVYIQGIQNNEIKNRDIRVVFICEDNFPQNNMVNIRVKQSVGKKSSSKELDIFRHDQLIEKQEYNFDEEGEYDICMKAVDKAGNVSEEKRVHFIVDKTAPEILLAGTEPYRSWDKNVKLSLTVKERFYQDNKLIIRGTRTDMDGKTVSLSMPKIEIDSEMYIKKLDFDKDGIYRFSIYARDAAGNECKKQLQFLIDKTAPEITGLEDYDGKYFRVFSPLTDTYGMFRDLTLKSYAILLNGIEYDENGIIGDGKYTLCAMAEDELGHKSEEMVEFVVDSKKPDVIFVGVDNKSTVYIPGKVSWMTDEPEDEIKRVIINDKEYDANLRELSYNTFGKYTIQIESVDKAGNEGCSELQFEYAEKRRREQIDHGITALDGGGKMVLVTLFPVLGCGILTVIIVLRKRKG